MDDTNTDKYCTWFNSDGADANDCDTGWSTSCGNEFLLNDGTPDDNDMKYCCYCGKPINQQVSND